MCEVLGYEQASYYKYQSLGKGYLESRGYLGPEKEQFQGRRPKIKLELYSVAIESLPLKDLRIAQRIPTRLSPEASLGIVENWISECGLRHYGCPSQMVKSLPKRVTDVESHAQHGGVSLLETNKGQKGHYIALSHCWGSGSFIQTITATLQQRKGS